MPEVYRPEADDDDELDDLIFEYTTRPSANLKEAIREIGVQRTAMQKL